MSASSRNHQALLLELYGDDSLPVRAVVDEPLTSDEEAQWLACATWRIDAPDWRLLVMGGFDPDVLSWWRDAGMPDKDGRGVAVIAATPGAWRVDLYAHAGSMNGRQILDEAHGALGAEGTAHVGARRARRLDRLAAVVGRA
jgi:hypothetical protein